MPAISFLIKGQRYMFWSSLTWLIYLVSIISTTVSVVMMEIMLLKAAPRGLDGWHAYAVLQGRLPQLHATAAEISELYALIKARSYPVSDLDAASFRTISTDFDAMLTLIKAVKDARSSMTEKFGEELNEGEAPF